MNWHRVDKTPDWGKQDPATWSDWQKTAAKTNGLVTPGNIVTLSGALMVSNGLIDIYNGHSVKGTAKVVIGRLADIADGYVADKTRTKSSRGKQLDILVDKCAKAAIAYTALKKFEMPILPGLAMYGLNFAESALALNNKDKWDELQPSIEGKLATFSEFSTMGLYTLSHLCKERQYHKASKSLKKIGHVAMATSLALRTKATLNVVKDVKE